MQSGQSPPQCVVRHIERMEMHYINAVVVQCYYYYYYYYYYYWLSVVYVIFISFHSKCRPS